MNSVAQLIILVTIILAAATKLSTAITQPRPDCPTTCGNLTNITFPFGTSPDCYLDDTFLITCNTSFRPPQPFLRRGNLRVLSILPEDGEMRVLEPVSHICYGPSGSIYGNITWRTRSGKFRFSYTRNKLTAVGCATIATITGLNYTTGCIAGCVAPENTVNESCTGIGCCETRIPSGVDRFNMTVTSLPNRLTVQSFNPCGYVFVAEVGSYIFNSLDLWNLRGREHFPLVLDWAIVGRGAACKDAIRNKSYACRSLNSKCVDSTNGPGYRCKCSPGFRGNPYLNGGCQDINECNETPNICDHGSVCKNSAGNYTCLCRKGYEDDGGVCRKKSHAKSFILLSVCLGVTTMCLLLLLMGSSWIYLILKKRKLIKQREMFFHKNGGLMLKQQLSEQEGSVEKARIFTLEDLKRATNNYDESRIIGQGGYGTVYKGVLLDSREVAIKKSKISDQSQIEQFINEVVILSQINHINVVKLIGCSLEAEVPLLVYEFIANGTLFDHIHNEGHASSLSWEMRLKIATESAEAIAYLHYAISTPIIHRDIKSTNILLDDNYTTKVSDFGASRLVPLNHTQLTTLVQGTFGYLDPEYFHTSKLTRKSDVYSFGVVLAELLTGKKALSFDRLDEDRNLAMYFVSSMKEDRLVEILDEKLVKEESIEQFKEVAVLVGRCLRVNGEERPTMKEVAMELEGIKAINKHSRVAIDFNTKESKELPSQSKPWDDGSSCSTTSGFDSLRERMSSSL